MGMNHKYYQACYAHPDTGWAVINTSENMPQELIDDFSSIERENAALASGAKVAMGDNKTPSCMYEIYFRNNHAGLVRVQYSLSDSQGRPISFAHGYIFPDAYELLKDPNRLLGIANKNFADQRLSEEERFSIRSVPGEYNRRLIEQSSIKNLPDEFQRTESYTIESSMKECGISEETYQRYILTIYSHLLSSNTDKNLYVKTDGTEEYAWKLLYLTYSAIPFSMRTLLSASTYLHTEQHNTKLIFCAELPENMPHIDPKTGISNVMSEIVEKRLRDRNPFIIKSLGHVFRNKHDQFFTTIEACLRLMGDIRLASMQAINIAYSFGIKEYDVPDKLPGLIYGWLALSVSNFEDWERIVCFLLKKADDSKVILGEETKGMLSERLKTAVTEAFKSKVREYLVSSDERM